MSTDELVQLYDGRGRAAGTAPRSRMRAENLVHGATAVVLRDPGGRVHVHRRTETKDVYPGRFDFAAGGVLGAGEDPVEGARRELAEELGVRGVPLEPLGQAFYGDDHTRYWGWLFTARWDGPVRLQAEEVAEGWWWPIETLAEHLADPDWPVMPDTAGLLGAWVRSQVTP